MDSDDEAAEVDEELIEDAYSVDFEEESLSPLRRSPTKAAEQSEENYSQASFEEESLSPAKHVVKLDAPRRTFAKPENVLKKEPPLVSTSIREAHVAAAPPVVVKKAAAGNYSFQEHSSLQQTNLQLQQKQHELQSQLNFTQKRQKDELRVRRERLMEKKKRAEDRRWQHEQLLRTSKAKVSDLEKQCEALSCNVLELKDEKKSLRSAKQMADTRVLELEAQNMKLATQLQQAFSDVQSITSKHQEAIMKQNELQVQMDSMKTEHQIQTQTLDNQLVAEKTLYHSTLQRERQERETERKTLPEMYQRMVDIEKENFQVKTQKIEQEVAKLTAELDKERARIDTQREEYVAAQTRIETTCQARIEKELDGIQKERQDIDKLRVELMDKQAEDRLRLETQRDALEAKKTSLEKSRLKLIEDTAVFKAEKRLFEEKEKVVLKKDAQLEEKKKEIVRLGQETMVNTERLSNQAIEYERTKTELQVLKQTCREMEMTHEKEKYDLKKNMDNVANMKHTLETMSHQVKHEKLLLAKERRASRQVLDGAQQLERLLKCQTHLHHPNQDVELINQQKLYTWLNRS